MSELRLHPLDLDTELAAQRAIDAVLREARAALVGRREHLASVEERAIDLSEAQILLWAELDGAPVGVIDVTLHHPEPGDLIVSQLAVAARARRRGVGRALVEAAALEAATRGVSAVALFAAVRPQADGARGFWTRLGFVDSPDHPDLLWSRWPLEGEAPTDGAAP